MKGFDQAMNLILATIPRLPQKDANEAATVAFTILGLIIAAGAIGYGLRAWRRKRDPMPLYFLAGGLLATGFEPLLDLAAGVWYPSRGGIVAFTAAGTRIPLFVPLYYIWIIGGQAYLCWRAFNRKASVRDLWKLAALIAVVDLVTESFGVPIGAYGYFGQQPLNPYGFPLWYPMVNTVAPMLAGAIFHVLLPRLPARQRWILPLAIPVGWAMACAGAGFPVWMSLHSDWPIWAAHIACAVTFVLGYFVMTICFAMTDSPRRSLDLSDDSVVDGRAPEPARAVLSTGAANRGSVR
jgi:hypothetical protein